MTFLAKLQKLEDALKASTDSVDTERSVYDFAARKAIYHQSLVKTALVSACNSAWEFAKSPKGQEKNIIDVLLLTMDLQKNIADRNQSLELINKIRTQASTIRAPLTSTTTVSIRAPRLPREIQATVAADLDEIRKCFESGCYRSVTILCGRVLETALHRMYYDVTGIDILEKNPGIGLGNLIAKLRDKNVNLDPGLPQQIHLINQVRIFSVHTKQIAFNPSQAQAHAMVLYMMDTLEKMF